MMTENVNSLCGTALSALILVTGILLFYCRCCEMGLGNYCAAFSFEKKARLLCIKHTHTHTEMRMKKTDSLSFAYVTLDTLK